MMNHSFDVEIAKKYGVHSAILFNHLAFWIAKNEANKQNCFDGRYWTYNSREAFSKLFPYMTARQISYALEKLIKDGLIMTGNYNANPYDKTLWYAITDFGYSILQNCQIEKTNLSNGEDEIVKPIPNNKPNDKTTDIKPNRKAKALDIESLLNEFVSNKSGFLSEEQKEALLKSIEDFIEMRTQKRNKPTESALVKLMAKAYDEAGRDFATMAKVFDQSTMSGWTGVFPLKNEGAKPIDNRYCTGANTDTQGNDCPF